VGEDIQSAWTNAPDKLHCSARNTFVLTQCCRYVTIWIQLLIRPETPGLPPPMDHSRPPHRGDKAATAFITSLL